MSVIYSNVSKLNYNGDIATLTKQTYILSLKCTFYYIIKRHMVFTTLMVSSYDLRFNFTQETIKLICRNILYQFIMTEDKNYIFLFRQGSSYFPNVYVYLRCP